MDGAFEGDNSSIIGINPGAADDVMMYGGAINEMQIVDSTSDRR